jgi:DNA repair protein RadC
MPVQYPTAEERIHLSGADSVPPEARSRARSTCASSRSKFEYLRIEVCAARKGSGPLFGISSSASVERFLREFLAPVVLLQEHFGVMSLDSKNHVIGFAIVAKGGLREVALEMPVVFKPSMLLPTHAIIVVHNHPSGDIKPSEADIEFTKRLVEVGRFLGIVVLDHVILGDENNVEPYFSFLDRGLLRHK